MAGRMLRVLWVIPNEPRPTVKVPGFRRTAPSERRAEKALSIQGIRISGGESNARHTASSGSTRRYLAHDPQAQIGRVPALFAEGRSEDRQAPQPRHLRQPRGGR